MKRKSDLHITIIPDVFYYCCILYNFTIPRGIVNVNDFMRRIILEVEDEVRSQFILCFHFVLFLSMSSFYSCCALLP
jgi:hypothetical protein